MRCRADGRLPAGIFDAQVCRIEEEELNPRGFRLLVRELPAGRTRFLIKSAATSEVCELLDYDADGTLQTSSANASPAPRIREAAAPVGMSVGA